MKTILQLLAISGFGIASGVFYGVARSCYKNKAWLPMASALMVGGFSSVLMIYLIYCLKG